MNPLRQFGWRGALGKGGNHGEGFNGHVRARVLKARWAGGWVGWQGCLTLPVNDQSLANSVVGEGALIRRGWRAFSSANFLM